MQSVKWSTFDKIRFGLGYLWARLAIFWTVRSPKWAYFSFEVRYAFGRVARQIVGHDLAFPKFNGPDEVETEKGRFKIRRDSHDALIVSPAYERADYVFAMELVDSLAKKSDSVGFLDIGANIGTFTIPIARKFLSRGVKVWAIEPIPDNVRYLKANAQLNGVEGITVFPYAVGDREEELTMRFNSSRGGDATSSSPTHFETDEVRVASVRADHLINDPPRTLVIKIDVEGHEAMVLTGMAGIFSRVETCWICVEDNEDRPLDDQLESLGFRFARKTTPYNSWWERPSGR